MFSWATFKVKQKLESKAKIGYLSHIFWSVFFAKIVYFRDYGYLPCSIFARIVNGFQALTIFAKSPPLLDARNSLKPFHFAKIADRIIPKNVTIFCCKTFSWRVLTLNQFSLSQKSYDTLIGEFLTREAFTSPKLCKSKKFCVNKLSRNANKKEFCEVNIREYPNFVSKNINFSQ